MAATQKTSYGVMSGEPGYKTELSVFAFATTGASFELPVSMTTVHGVFLTFVGTPAADEVLSLDEATLLGTKGQFTVPSTGTITITRTGASKTSGIQVMAYVLGQ